MKLKGCVLTLGAVKLHKLFFLPGLKQKKRTWLEGQPSDQQEPQRTSKAVVPY